MRKPAMGSTRTAWVTGAAKGIGRRLVSALVTRGYAVAASDVDVAALERTHAAELWPSAKVGLVPLDVRDADAWEAGLASVMERWGRVDVLANVAGVLRPGLLLDAPAEDYDFHFDVNVRGTINGCRIAARQMKRAGAGHIVNIASFAGLIPVPGYTYYSPSKSAVRAFSLLLAAELRPHGVAVSVVCPDVVKTAMYETNRQHADIVGVAMSSGSVLTPDEVARVIADDVLVRRPLQRTIPRHRGLLLNLLDGFPRLAAFTMAALQRRGAKRAASIEPFTPDG